MPAQNGVAIAFDHTEAFSTARRSARILKSGERISHLQNVALCRKNAILQLKNCYFQVLENIKAHRDARHDVRNMADASNQARFVR